MSNQITDISKRLLDWIRGKEPALTALILFGAGLEGDAKIQPTKVGTSSCLVVPTDGINFMFLFQ